MSRAIWWGTVDDKSTGLPEFIRIVNRRMRGLRDSGHLLLIHLDGGGGTLTTGHKLDVPLPNFGISIEGWTLVADQSGSLVIDLWSDTYGNYPPTVADTITASAKPTLSSAIKNEAESVPTWTKNIARGKTIRVNVDSATTVTRATLALSVYKT